MEIVIVILLLPFLLALYFLPWIIAIRKKHKQTTAIFVLSLTLGWLLIPWCIALTWAFMNENKKKSISKQAT